MPEGQPLRPGDPVRLGAYRVTGRLGEGTQGVVYLGEGPSGVRVAIKLLHARMAADQEARDRFVRELAAAKKVARFCTAQVLDADVAGDHPYIVSEYVEGRSLRSHIASDGPRADGALERLAISTLTALSAIHKAGIVHRDFTPHNVLLGPDGPRVIDFGIARALGAAQHTKTNNVGTPAYMAPEQVTGGDVGPPCDMFGWGATILYAGTARPPFGNESVPAVMQRVLHSDPEVSALPEPLRSVVAACLHKDPARRPTAPQAQARLLGHDAEGAAESTAEISAGPPPHDEPVAPASVLTPARLPESARSGRPKMTWVAVAGGAVVVAAAALIVPLWPDGGDAATAPHAKTSASHATSASPSPGRHVAQVQGAFSPRPKKKKHRSKADCRDYSRAYGVTGVGTVLLKASVCRQEYSGTVVTADTAPKDSWDVCVQLRGHLTSGPFISTPIMSSRGGGMHGFDNGPVVRFGKKTRQREDRVVVNTGRCRGTGAKTQSAWQSHDQLATG